MKIKRVEHVALAVHDMAESMAMLENTLGLELDYEETIGETKLAMFPVGETYLELLQAGGPASPVADWIAERGQSLYHLCFEVEDIDAALNWLRPLPTEGPEALVDEVEDNPVFTAAGDD